MVYFEDFKTGDIEHTNEETTFDGLGVEGLVASEVRLCLQVFVIIRFTLC